MSAISERILTVARVKVAAAVQKCQVQAGPGVTLQGRGVRVWEMPDSRVAGPGDNRVNREARTLVVEVVGERGYVNVPPVYGAVATLGGQSVFGDPRPFFRVTEEPVSVWARLRYRRREALLGSEAFPDSDPLGVGLQVEGVELTVEVLAVDAAPETIEATGGERSLPPFAGQYERWFRLGTASTAGAVASVNAFPAWGGIWPVTQGIFDSEISRYVFNTRDVQS